MADVVPLNRRVDIRQEILSMKADDEALKVRECQEIKVKVQRSLNKKRLRASSSTTPRWTRRSGRREPTSEESSARRRHKELVTEEMLDNEMAILAPLQEGMQALPSEEVANEGACALRKVNLERFKPKLRDQYLEGKGVDASQALAEAMGSIQEAQEANKLNHTLKPLEVSAWPDDLRQALERGLFCPLKLDDPEDIPNV